MARMERTHSRAMMDGSIIRPTAIRVPMAWNPATRLNTTNMRKTTCHNVLRPPRVCRNNGSMTCASNAQRAMNSASTVTPATTASNSKADASMASTEPNSKCNRSAWLP